MKQRARRAIKAAASAYGHRWGWGWDGARWLRIGAGCALCFSLAGSAVGLAEETSDPGAGRAPLPAVARPEEAKLKAAVKPPDKLADKNDKAKRPGLEVADAQLADSELALIAELRGHSEPVAMAAAKKLGAVHSPRALDALLDSLAMGVTPKLAGAVLDALATYKSASDAQPGKSAEILQVLTVYMHHRNPELRKHAVQGLAALIAPVTETAGGTAKTTAKPSAKVAAKAAPGGGYFGPSGAAGDSGW